MNLRGTGVKTRASPVASLLPAPGWSGEDRAAPWEPITGGLAGGTLAQLHLVCPSSFSLPWARDAPSDPPKKLRSCDFSAHWNDLTLSFCHKAPSCLRHRRGWSAYDVRLYFRLTVPHRLHLPPRRLLQAGPVGKGGTCQGPVLPETRPGGSSRGRLTRGRLC